MAESVKEWNFQKFSFAVGSSMVEKTSSRKIKLCKGTHTPSSCMQT